jgi:4-hydroxy-4-methyl-2-oxoglutarate aldolase
MFDAKELAVSHAPVVDGAFIKEIAALDLPAFGHFLEQGFLHSLRQIAGNPALVAGRAVTCSFPGNDSRILHYATGLVEPGDILLVDACGAGDFACVGGGIATALTVAGAAGVVIDGWATDVQELQASGLRVFAKGLHAVTTRRNQEPLQGTINQPIMMDGVVVQPGDIVLIDGNGVLVATLQALEEVIEKVRAAIEWEPAAMRRVTSGTRLAEVTLDLNDLTRLDNILNAGKNP